jgi:hypothetical protein
VDHRFALKDPALSILSVRLRVPLHDIDILDEETVLFIADLENLSDLAFIFAGDDLNFVIYFDFN